MKTIFQNMVKLLKQGESFALVSIITKEGSAPRTAGTRMIVRSDGTQTGTIGGGALEAHACSLCRDVFAHKLPLVTEFSLTADAVASMDMICGGKVELLVDYQDAGDPALLKVYEQALDAIEHRRTVLLITGLGANQEATRLCIVESDGSTAGQWVPDDMLVQELRGRVRGRHQTAVELAAGRYLVEPVGDCGTVYVFGGGHISCQLAMLTAIAGFRTVVLDDREEYANRRRFPLADDVLVPPSFAEALSGIDIDSASYIVIVTRGHRHDKSVLAASLQTDARYVGMIGSRKKRDAIYEALLQEGYTPDDLERVHAPIGIDIGAESPEEVAISIVAELILERARFACRTAEQRTPEPAS